MERQIEETALRDWVWEAINGLSEPLHHVVCCATSARTRGLAEDFEARVRLSLLRVVAGAGLTVVDGAFHNPADAPDHCPPLTTQVYWHRGEEIVSLHLAFSFG